MRGSSETRRRRRRPITVAGLLLTGVLAAGGVAGAQLADLDSAGLVAWAVDAQLIDEPLDEEELATSPDRLEVLEMLRRLDLRIGERSVNAGPITVSHPPALAVAHAGDAIAVAHEGGRVDATGAGRVLVPLTAPAEVGGRKLVFSSVELCLEAVAPGDVIEVVVLQSPDGGGVVPASEVPAESGCTTYTGAGSGWMSGQAATVQVEIAGGRSVQILSVSSTWVPS